MIAMPAGVRIVVAARPVDFRAGFAAGPRICCDLYNRGHRA